MASTDKRLSAIGALEKIQDNIGAFEDVGATEAEADFLEDFFDSRALQALMQGLLSAHDDVAKENYGIEHLKPLDLAAPPPPAFDGLIEDHRLVTITKQGKQPLGVTVSLDSDNNLIIARILQGSLADKQGLLHVEDKVREVNGVEVYTPEDMIRLLKEASTSVTMKIVPSHRNLAFREQFFIRSNFNYDPMNDRLIPCKKAGLPFRQNDILEVVSTADENWWQARAVSGTSHHGPVGLVPSRTLQEKRSAFVQPAMNNTKTSLFCGLKVKKKKQIDYNSNNNTEYDDCDIKVYEEVTLTNFHTRVLALVGARHVGKQSLIKKLVQENPRRFQAAIPYTSRPMGDRDVDGHGYFFVERDTMEQEIRENKFLDYGEFDGHLYGIKFSTVRAIIKTGRVCVMAVSPNALKMIKSPDFQPYIVFVAAPSVSALKVMFERQKLEDEPNPRHDSRSSRPSMKELFQEEIYIQTVKDSQTIEKMYRGYFDDTIVNDDFDTTYNFLKDRMDKLHCDAKWIPVDWKQ